MFTKPARMAHGHGSNRIGPTACGMRYQRRLIRFVQFGQDGFIHPVDRYQHGEER